jgi:hypothetical protein
VIQDSAIKIKKTPYSIRELLNSGASKIYSYFLNYEPKRRERRFCSRKYFLRKELEFSKSDTGHLP